MVKLENEDEIKTEIHFDEIKTEIHFDDLPCKDEIKTENYIPVKKELVKTECRNFGQFSKSEEDSLMYCLESMPPAYTKKRKIDLESLVEKDSLKEVQQKIIEKLSNDLVNLTESKRKMKMKYKSRITNLKERLLIIETSHDSELPPEKDLPLEEIQQTIIEKMNILNELHQSEIKDLRQRLSKNALIIREQSKDLECLIEQSKNLKILERKKMELKNDKFALETFKLNEIIRKQKKHIDTLW